MHASCSSVRLRWQVNDATRVYELPMVAFWGTQGSADLVAHLHCDGGIDQGSPDPLVQPLHLVSAASTSG